MRLGVRAVSALVFLLAVAAPLLAQEESGIWSLDSELGASLFFGASEQAALALRSSVSRDSPVLDASAGFAFAYGEARRPGASGSFVNKRAWSADGALNYRPGGRFSPFLFARSEGSFERQIDLRVSMGVGAKLRFVRAERSRLDVSLAVLAERTQPRAVPGLQDAAETLARWSARLRAGHELADGRTTLSLVTFYRPAFEDAGDYTVNLESSVAYALNSSIGLKLSFVDTYDALAEDRGATSNNDGRLLFSILATAG